MTKKLFLLAGIICILFVSGLAIYSYAADAGATCTGIKNCKVCKNCKYCKHCSKDGGTCGVCK